MIRAFEFTTTQGEQFAIFLGEENGEFRWFGIRECNLPPRATGKDAEKLPRYLFLVGSTLNECKMLCQAVKDMEEGIAEGLSIEEASALSLMPVLEQIKKEGK